jgi:hypothetical protein
MHVSLDESGKFRSTENLAFFGLVADLPDWESFSTDWNVLAGEHRIKSIHTAELMGRSLEYQGRTFSSRQEKLTMLEEFLRLVNDRARAAVGVAVHNRAFRAMSQKSRDKCYGDAHVFCFRTCIDTVIPTVADIYQRRPTPEGPPPSASFIFDDNEEYGAECYTLFTKVRQLNPTWKKWVRSICFVDDKTYPPVQAADILAWLLRNMLATPKENSEHLSYEEMGRLVDVGTSELVRWIRPFTPEKLQSLDNFLTNGKTLDDLEIKPIRPVSRRRS